MNRHTIRFIALYGAVCLVLLAVGLIEIATRFDSGFSHRLANLIGADMELFIRWHIGDLVYCPFLGGIFTTVLVAFGATPEDTIEETRARAHILTQYIFVFCTVICWGHYIEELEKTPTDPDVIMFAIPLIAAVIFYIIALMRYKNTQRRLGVF